MAVQWVRRAIGSKLVLLAVTALGILAACDSKGTDTEVRTVWTLASVNGQVLPAPYPDPFLPRDVFQVTEGRLSVGVDDRSIVLELRMRCAPHLSEQECGVEGDGRHRHEGQHSAAGDQVVMNGRSYPAEFGETRIRITVQTPPSDGVFRPAYVLEFTRQSTTVNIR